MRFPRLALAATALALLAHCSGVVNGHHSRSTHRPQVFTGITEYYHGGSKPSIPPPAAPLPRPSGKTHLWARLTGSGPDSQGPVKGAMVTQRPSTHGPIFANPDGTTSRVVGNALIRSDGTQATMIGNTAFHPNGAKSRIVGDTLINPDGSQSLRVNENP